MANVRYMSLSEFRTKAKERGFRVKKLRELDNCEYGWHAVDDDDNVVGKFCQTNVPSNSYGYIRVPVQRKVRSKKEPVVIRGKDYELGNQLRLDVLKQLRNELCEVRFLKADGTKRIMQCTLLETFLPDLKQTIRDRKDAPIKDPFTITVWDTEKEAWRAFKLETFLRLTVL